jgi:hypothetical protein
MRAIILIGTLCLASTAWAGLIGTTVTGSLQFGGGGTNYYDPANLYVPASGYLNSSPGGSTVTIAEPAIEFGYHDSFNTDTANFTNTQLIFTDASTSGSGPYTLTFTDSAFEGVSVATSTLPGMTFGFNGDSHTITINLPNGVSAGTWSGTFNVSSEDERNPTPEPATLWLFGAGLALLAVRRVRWSR